MGHLEPIAVFFVVLTVLLLVKRRAAWAAVAAALGVAAKLGPLAAVPMWARQSRRPILFSSLAAGLGLVLFIPLFSGAKGLGIYAVSWEFNGPLYEPLWRWLKWLEVDLAIKSFLAAVETWSGDHHALDFVYPFVYPRLLAKLILAAAAAVLVVRSAFWKGPVEGAGALFGGLLLCAATLYPWYLLWVLPWAALTQHRAFLALSATSMLCYLPQFYGVSHMPWIFFLVWGPFWLLLWRSRWRID
jgi:hypothetical protein